MADLFRAIRNSLILPPAFGIVKVVKSVGSAGEGRAAPPAAAAMAAAAASAPSSAAAEDGARGVVMAGGEAQAGDAALQAAVREYLRGMVTILAVCMAVLRSSGSQAIMPFFHKVRRQAG